MLNRTKYFRKLCLSGSFLVGLISLSSTANAQFIGINADLFYNVPFPVVSITVGFGYGADNLNTGVETKTTIVENNTDKGTSDSKDSVSEAFFHIGLPFWNTVEFHLGYHLMSFTSIDITSNKKFVSFDGDYTIDKKSYSGGMTTIGVQIAF